MKEPQKTLSGQRIVLAALALVRQRGVEKLSMRQLARDLDVTPMAIYHHVGDKDGLLERMADAILARVPRPSPANVHWREALVTIGLGSCERLSEFPGLADYLMQREPTQQLQELGRYCVSVLLAAGFEEEVADRALTTFSALIFGMVGMQAHTERLRRMGLPRTARDELAQNGIPNLIAWGLDTFARGLGEKLSTHKRGSTERARRARRVAPRMRPTAGRVAT